MNVAATAPLEVNRHDDRFLPDARRVLLRPFVPANPQRIANIIGRVLRLSEAAVESLLEHVRGEFDDRHIRLEQVLERQYQRMRPYLPADANPSPARRLLLGSYFTAEYALESAALFNPSIVLHSDQSYVPPGWVRFIMSFRATGEGHISSIEFRTGIVDAESHVVMDRPGRYVTEAEVIPNAMYERALFQLKLREMGFDNQPARDMLAGLNDWFTISELRQAVQTHQRNSRSRRREEQRTRDTVIWLAESNYEITFDSSIALSERAIFPISANERNGIEDARFVRFVDDDKSVTYYATYTAYNGLAILPQLLATRDFQTFNILSLNGRAVANKGMALFPRKIDGKFAMISRQDNENLFIMFSDNLHFWHDMERILTPSYAWEFVQLGNCGSPIETDAGWVLLTHGVGAVRKYCIGAVLLDLHDPAKVLRRLRDPLLAPNENEREGYVPNVVYTCGALLHNGRLIIPYAMSDRASSICSVSLDDLLAHMEPVEEEESPHRAGAGTG